MGIPGVQVAWDFEANESFLGCTYICPDPLSPFQTRDPFPLSLVCNSEEGDPVGSISLSLPPHTHTHPTAFLGVRQVPGKDTKPISEGGHGYQSHQPGLGLLGS